MQTAVDKEVGRVLRRIRFELGQHRGREMSQEEFGAVIGKALGSGPYRQPTVSAWEKGEVSMSARGLVVALRLLSEALGKQVCYEDLLPSRTRVLTAP